MIIYQDEERLRLCVSALRGSQHATFYADKYSELPESYVLEDIPLLTREELVATHPDNRCYVTKDAVRFIASTSGTSNSVPLLSFMSDVASYHIDPAWGTDIQRPLVVFPPLNKNFGGTFIQQCAQAPRPLTPVFGDPQNMATSAVLAASVGCDSLYVTPSYGFALAPEIKKYYDPTAIRYVFISGESISESKLLSLRALYPNAKFANLYASSEIGQFIMGPTKDMIIDDVMGFAPLTEAIIALELIEGELVVTYDLNGAFPLVRYRTGDHFVVSNELTEQYSQNGVPVLIWEGKGGVDVVRLSGLEIRAGSVDDFFGTLPQQIEEYQLHVYASDTVEAVRLVLEYVAERATGATTGIIRDTFVKNFIIDKKGVVADAIEHGDIESVTVEPVTQLSLVGAKRRVLVNHIV